MAALSREELKCELRNQREEAAFNQKLDHQNIINILHIVDRPEEVCIALPLMQHSLNDEIEDMNYAYTHNRAKQIMTMLLNGLNYMHEKHLMHRDLKPDNILVDLDGSIKIADFGLTLELDDNLYYMEVCGTKPYMAPEIFLKFGYTALVDIWVSTLFSSFVEFLNILIHFLIFLVCLSSRPGVF